MTVEELVTGILYLGSIFLAAYLICDWAGVDWNRAAAGRVVETCDD